MGKAKRRQTRATSGPAIVAHRRRWQALAWPYGAIFIAALTLRFLYVASIRHAYFFAHLQTEPLRYLQWSTLILTGSTPPPPYDEPPGYAYFVAAVFAVFGRSVAAAARVQAVVDAMSCLLVAAIGTRWFGRRAGVIAGYIAACYCPMIYFSGELLPATLFLFIAMAAVAAVVLPEKPRWLLSGVLWPAALLVRLEAGIAYPFLLLDAWWRGRRGALSRMAVPAAVLLVMLSGHAISAGWPKILNSTTGLNLWLGNNPDSDGVNPFIFGPLQPAADGITQQTHNAAEADGEFRQHAFTFWSEQPGAALRLLWKKFVWTFADRELPNTSDIDWQTAQSWLFRPPLFPLSFGIVLPLTLAGAVLIGTQWRRLPLLLGLIATGTLIPVLLFTNARVRLIMAPALILLAGAGGARLPALLRQPAKCRAPLLRASVAMAVGIILAWSNFYGIHAYRIPQIAVNTGVLERAAGQFAAAVAHLRDGLAADPTDSYAWAQLAMALEQQGERRAALQAYLEGLANAPHDDTLPRIAASFFQRQQLDLTLLNAYQRAETKAAQQTVVQQTFQAFDSRNAARPRSD